MAANNLTRNNRRSHSIKILAQTNRTLVNKKTENKSISHQYKIIRKDVLKLRNDLALGYDLIKRWLVSLRQKGTASS